MTDSVTVQSSALEERLAFETMLSDLSSRFVNLEPAEVDREIDNALRQICECLGLDIAALWQLSPEEPEVLKMTNLFLRLDGRSTISASSASTAVISSLAPSSPISLQTLFSMKIQMISPSRSR